MVHYLTMKKRFNHELSEGGLNLSGTFVIGDGRINPTSGLNNTRLDPNLNYRVRFVVFTSETLYTISEPLDIPAFVASSTADLIQSVYIGILIAIGIVLVLTVIMSQVKKRLTIRADIQMAKDTETMRPPAKGVDYFDVSPSSHPSHPGAPSAPSYAAVTDEIFGIPWEETTKYLDVSSGTETYETVEDVPAVLIKKE